MNSVQLEQLVVGAATLTLLGLAVAVFIWLERKGRGRSTPEADLLWTRVYDWLTLPARVLRGRRRG